MEAYVTKYIQLHEDLQGRVFHAELMCTHRVSLHVGTVPAAHTQLHRDVAMAFLQQRERLPV